MRTITLFLILLVTFAPIAIDAAWYQKTDLTVVDPIQRLGGGNLSYTGNNLEPDVSLAGARTFVKAVGGAPANVAVGVKRLGASVGLIAVVGNDPFGEFLEAVVRTAGVDTRYMVRTDEARTSLAFIAARSDGKKDISFYRHPGADMFLRPEDVDMGFVASAKVFHFGSISLLDKWPAKATVKALMVAQHANSMVTYDPNWRPSLWPDPVEARKIILSGLDGAHVAKLSEEEWPFITGCEDFPSGAAFLLGRGPELVVRSEGPGGASFATSEVTGHVPAFEVDCVEPTGAGDGFMACLIVELLAHWRNNVRPSRLRPEELKRIVRRANAVGALACTTVGGIPSLPTAQEVDAFLTGR